MPNADTRKNFGVRLPASLIAAIESQAKATGQNKTQIVEAALGAYLGIAATPTEGQDVEQRLTEIEQRLANVEQRLTENAQRRPTPPDAPEPPPAASSALLPAPGEGFSIGAALIAAAAPISHAQATSGNRDRAMRQATGKTARDWLQAQGWILRGREWFMPQ